MANWVKAVANKRTMLLRAGEDSPTIPLPKGTTLRINDENGDAESVLAEVVVDGATYMGTVPRAAVNRLRVRTEVITGVCAERVDFVKAEYRKAGAKSVYDEPDEPDGSATFRVTATFEDGDEREHE